MKADVRRVQRNRQVRSHLMGKGNTYEAGSDTHQATRCGPETDPSKRGKTNKRRNGKMKSLRTDATSKPFGANCALLPEHQTMLYKTWLQEIHFIFTQQTCASCIFSTGNTAATSAAHPAPI